MNHPVQCAYVFYIIYYERVYFVFLIVVFYSAPSAILLCNGMSREFSTGGGVSLACLLAVITIVYRRIEMLVPGTDCRRFIILLSAPIFPTHTHTHTLDCWVLLIIYIIMYRKYIIYLYGLYTSNVVHKVYINTYNVHEFCTIIVFKSLNTEVPVITGRRYYCCLLLYP